MKQCCRDSCKDRTCSSTPLFPSSQPANGKPCHEGCPWELETTHASPVMLSWGSQVVEDEEPDICFYPPLLNSSEGRRPKQLLLKASNFPGTRLPVQ